MSSGAPVEHGTPIRYPSTALLCVNSADAEVFQKVSGERVDNNYPSRVYINNGRPLMFGYMTRVALTEVNLQWDTPNVNPNNNTITISCFANGHSETRRTTLTPGWYKPTELATALQSQLVADWSDFLVVTSGSPWSVTINPKTLAVTITAVDPPAPGDWEQFVFSIIPCSAKNFGLTPLQLDLTDMLGLTPSTITPGVAQAGVSSITGGYATYQYTPFVDIVSNLLTKNQNVADGDTSKQVVSSKLARLYLSNEEIVSRTEDNIIGVRPFVFRREFQSPKQIQWNTTENVDVIDISVLDYKGNPVYITPIYTPVGEFDAVIGNTADFMFTVQVTEI